MCSVLWNNLPLQIDPLSEKAKEINGNVNVEKAGDFQNLSDPDHLTAVQRPFRKWAGRELIYPISLRFSDFHFVSVKSSLFLL